MVIIFLLLTISVNTFFGMKRANDGAGKDSYRYDAYELEEGADFSDRALETFKSDSYNQVEIQEPSEKPLSIPTQNHSPIGKPEEPSYDSESITAKEATTASSSSHSSNRNKTLTLYRPSKTHRPHKTFDEYKNEKESRNSSTNKESAEKLKYTLSYYNRCLHSNKQFVMGKHKNDYHLLPFILDKITIDEGVARESTSSKVQFTSYKKKLQVYDADKIINKESINQKSQSDLITCEVCKTRNGVIFHRGYFKNKIIFCENYENSLSEIKTSKETQDIVSIQDPLSDENFGGQMWRNQFGEFVYSPLLKKHFLIRWF